MQIEKKLKCILLDDEMPSLRFLKMLCEQIPGLEVVKAFNEPVTLLQEYKELSFDFVFWTLKCRSLMDLM